MPNYLPTPTRDHLVATQRSLPPTGRYFRQTTRALDLVGHRTLVRQASTQAEGIVATEKVRELQGLARHAMSGQAMLRNWADTLAHGDPFLADDMKFFTDMARLGAGEIIADLVDSYCRESRS